MIDLSNKLVNDKKNEEALSVLKFSTELFSESFSVYLSYAMLLFNNNQIALSAQNYKQSVNLYSGSETEKENLLNSLGYEFLIGNELESAEFILKLNTELYPKSCGAYDSYASALDKNNKLDLAILMQEKAVTIATEQNDKLLPTLNETLKNLKSKKH